MEIYSSGLKSLKSGGIDATTGLPTALTSVGSVYKDSVGFTGGAVSSTDIFSQQEPNTPKKRFNKKAPRQLVFEVMSSDVDTLAKFGVGEITTLDSVKTLHLFDNAVTIEKSFELVTDDGNVLTVLRGDVVAEENWKVSDEGIWLTKITITPLVPNIAGLTSATLKNGVPA